MGLYVGCSHYNRDVSDINDKGTHAKGEVQQEVMR